MYTSVLNWLDRVAALYPERAAYIDKQNALTFAEVNRISHKIGAFLHTHGVLPGNPVIVMGDRSVYTPACFLGVVRAGCFYAPIDGEMPATRIHQLLEVIDTQYMIVSRSFLEITDNLLFSGTLFVLEDILQEDDQNSEVSLSPDSEITESSPLYVIFTSGSSGKPKGVITPHYALMCYIDAVQSVLHINENDVLGNQAPLDYIAAIRDIYLPLYTGASSVIIPKNEFGLSGSLFKTLNEYSVTTLCWSTAGLEVAAKLGAFSFEVPKYLKRVIFSGAVISNKYLRLWQDHLPDVRFINQYGPTEATASCTWYEVTEKVEKDSLLPIGKPYPHYHVFLLDENDQTPSCGDVGEICISGPVLALGYYRDPDRTKFSFVQNPLNSSYQEVIYRTGDLGRYREDGLLLFVGRKDRQVKHFGHRIELDEIEVEASKVDGVEDCCAVYNARKSVLCLFYSGQAEAKEITRQFRADLPAFMLPQKIRKLDEIPKLPNGKTNIQQLNSLLEKKAAL